ncbi:hypothetical protein QZH41_010699 [Actinostola sp. cb2023]|nr:hypothetical protein QZH41_010699 [Actinostola sp. cb2023]
MKRLNALKLCQSHQNWLRTLDNIGDHLVDTIKEEMKEGSKPRLTFDNFDFRVNAGEMLKGISNVDRHWICQYLTFDRVDTATLDNTQPLGDLKDLDIKAYLLSDEEQEHMRDEYIVLVSRILTKVIPWLTSLEKTVPCHIDHEFSEQMSKKSVVIALPVKPYDQKKHSEVIQYLDTVQTFAKEISDEGESLMQLPLGGDLLGRERVTGAKKLRRGCDEPEERFDNIVEVAEYWHAKQSLLSLCWKHLYNQSSGREPGTLYYFRNLHGRTNVKPNVKNNYAAAEGLLLHLAKAYICCAFMHYAGMCDLKGRPTKVKEPGQNVLLQGYKYLHDIIGKFVDEYCLFEPDIDKLMRKQNKKEQQQQQQQQQPPGAIQKEPSEEHKPAETKDPKDEDDHMTNYALWVMQFGLLLMQMNDTEKEGDGERAMRNNKLLLLMFRTGRHGKKYAFEMLRMISKVKCQLTEQMSVRNIHGRFVNWKGGKGKNCANDLKQEHLVKFTKKLVRGMGAQKTEQAINRATSAAGGLQYITENFDDVTGVHPGSTADTYKNAEEDINDMVNIINNIKVFQEVPGRTHPSFPNLPKSVLDTLNIVKMEKWMKRCKTKLAKNPDVPWDATSDDDESEDDDSDLVFSEDSDDDDED